MSLYDLLARCSAHRVIVLQSFDVIANDNPRALLMNKELIQKGYIVVNIDVCFSFGCILIVEVC